MRSNKTLNLSDMVMMRNLTFKEGEVFFRPLFCDHVRIAKIETHYLDANRKKVKYTNEIYHIEYLLNFKPQFTTYLKDVQQMVSFDRWIKTQ